MPPPATFTAHDLMKAILQLMAQRSAEPERFTQLMSAAGIRPLEGRIYFLTQLRERLRMLPLKLFLTPDTREKILEALQTAVDREIAQEETT
jgi:type III secretion system TyeA family effector delivery regulator